MREKRLKVALITLVAFMIAFYLYPVLKLTIGSFLISFPSWFRTIIYYLTWLIPIVIALIVLYGLNFRRLTIELGLNANILKGFIFTSLATLPMLVGYAWMSKLNVNVVLSDLLKNCLFAAIMEEILFRGFLFGHLYRKAGWGFVPAVALNAFVFGVGHLYQGSTWTNAIGVFIITLMGGAWFA